MGVPAGPDPLGQQLDVAGLAPPALDEAELGPAADRFLEQLPVAADRHPRVVRREHEADDLLRPTLERPFDGLRDPRLPVPHAGEDRQAELGLERGARLLGDLVQRVRVLDPEPLVAGDEVGQKGGRDRPAAADVGVVSGDVLEPVRRAVRHQDDGCGHAAMRAVCSWTSSRRRPSTPGSVSGTTP